jgi:hypothetical protein
VLFKELPDSAITVKVGLKKTAATYFVNETRRVRSLLNKFIEADRNKELNYRKTGANKMLKFLGTRV